MGSTDVVGAVIIRGGQVLLVRTNKHPEEIWHFPGGKWENGEKVTGSLARKLLVELPGLRFRIYNLLGIYWREVYEDGMIRLIVYRVSLWTSLSASELRLGEGIQEARWVRLTVG